MCINVVVAVDLGGTAIKHGIVSEDGKMLSKDQVPTVELSFDAVVARLADVINTRNEECKTEGYILKGVGIGVPGGLYKNRRVISQSPNFPDWKDVPMAEALENQTGLSVFLENDGNLAALGECWVGAGIDEDSLCAFTLGTGVGGGLVLDGNIWTGVDGMAAEVGWVTVYPDKPSGLAGGWGTLEPLASARGIGIQGTKAVKSGKSEALSNVLKNAGGELEAKDIYLAAEDGDEVAIEVLQDAGFALGIAISNIVNLLNLHLFVVGGGAAPAIKYMEPVILREVQNRCFRIPAKGVQVKEAELGNDAGMFGAARIAFQRKGLME